MPPLDPLEPDPTSKPPAYESFPDADRPASLTTTEGELEAQTPGGSKEVHDPYAAWRFRNFRLYTTGSFAWWIGRQMLGVVVGWQVYALTNSKAALGLVGLQEAIPLIALALPAGHMADRYNRKTITVIMTAVIALSSLCLAVLSYTNLPAPQAAAVTLGTELTATPSTTDILLPAHSHWLVPEWPILRTANHWLEQFALLLGDTDVHFDKPVIPLLFLLFFLTGLAQAFAGPSRSALLPSIIPIEYYSNAATWNSSIGQISSMAGPAMAGMLMWALAGKHYAFSAVYMIDALCITFFCCMVGMIHYVHQPKARTETMGRSLSAGVRFVFTRKIILATITLDMFAVLLGGAVILLPVYAKDILHVGPMGFGWLRAAPALGAFVMALAIAHLPPMTNAGRTLLWAVAGFGVATIVFGLSDNFWLSMLALLLTGAYDNISVVVRHTLVQVLTPDSMRGRVSAVNNIFIGASNELGGFRAGVTAAMFGTVTAVVAGGVGTILVVAAVALGWPDVRRFGSLKDARPLEEEPDQKSPH